MSVKVKVPRVPSCDLCQQKGVRAPAKYDGKTKFGPWANMCTAHFEEFGLGLGTGLGQELVTT